MDLDGHGLVVSSITDKTGKGTPPHPRPRPHESIRSQRNQNMGEQDYGRSSGAPSAEDRLANDVDPPCSCIYWRRTLLLHLLVANPALPLRLLGWESEEERLGAWGVGRRAPVAEPP